MMPSNTKGAPLRGLTVSIVEHRYGREFGAMLERQGATICACPLVEERPVQNREEVQAFIRKVVSGSLSMMVFLTGVGARFLVEEAERMGEKGSFLEALGRLKVVARGPKPVAVLHRLGVRVDVKPKKPTSEGVVEALSDVDLSGARVGVQLYGVPNPTLCEALKSRGAEVLAVQVYSYGTASNAGETRVFIEKILGGTIDVIIFTSAPQVRALFEASEASGLAAALAACLGERPVVAAIGGVTNRALVERGVEALIIPDDPSLASLARAVGAFFEREASYGSGR
jgi:uroporphyrinogen-III synthase